MRVLIGCEESGVVRRAFEARGHEAYSNDIIPARDAGRHIQKDVKVAILDDGPWDLIILHPDCTKVCCAGNKYYGSHGPRYSERLKAIEWIVDLWEIATTCARVGVVLENPLGVLPNTRMCRPQFIQPWQHGHMEKKKTGLWLYNLEPLLETHNVYSDMMKLPLRQRERIHWMQRGLNRKRDRSETYSGVAWALAAQYGVVGRSHWKK